MTKVSDERLAEMLSYEQHEQKKYQKNTFLWEQHRLRIDALTELQSLRSQPEPAGVRVKGLEWEADDPNWWVSAPSSMLGGLGYEVRITDSGKVRARKSGEPFFDFDGTADEAKAFWQADYERRILSALTEQQGEVVSHEVVYNGEGYSFTGRTSPSNQEPVAVTEGKEAMLALEVIERLIRENIHDNGTDINRMLIDGVWHTGPVVDASFRILKGLHKIASAALSQTQGE